MVSHRCVELTTPKDCNSKRESYQASNVSVDYFHAPEAMTRPFEADWTASMTDSDGSLSQRSSRDAKSVATVVGRPDSRNRRPTDVCGRNTGAKASMDETQPTATIVATNVTTREVEQTNRGDDMLHRHCRGKSPTIQFGSVWVGLGRFGSVRLGCI